MPTAFRKIRRWSLRLGLALLSLVVVALLAVIVLFRWDATRERVGGSLGEMLSEPGVFGLRIVGVGEGFPWRIALRRLSIGDGEGYWLEIEDVELRWSVLPLLRAEYDVESLTAAAVRYHRNPVASEEEEDEDEEPFDWTTDLPVVDIDRLFIEELDLAEPVVGVASQYRVRGEGHLGDWDTARVALVFDRLEVAEADIGGSVPSAAERVTASGLNLEVSSSDRPLLFQAKLQVDDPADGFLAAALVEPLGLLSPKPLSATLELQGGTDAFDLDVRASMADAVAATLSGTVDFEDESTVAELALTLDAPVLNGLGDDSAKLAVNALLKAAPGKLDIQRFQAEHGRSEADLRGVVSWSLPDDDSEETVQESFAADLKLNAKGTALFVLSGESTDGVDAKLDASFVERVGKAQLNAVVNQVGTIDAVLNMAQDFAYSLSGEAALIPLFERLGLGTTERPLVFSFAGLFEPEHKFVLDDGEVHLGEARLTADADVELESLSGVAHLALSEGLDPVLNQVLRPLLPFSLGGLSLEARAGSLVDLGGAGTFAIQLKASEFALEELTVGDLDLRVDGNSEGRSDRGVAFDLTATVSEVMATDKPLPLLGARFTIDGDAVLAADGNSLILDRLAVDGEALDLQVSGKTSEAWQHFDADLKTQIEALASLEDLVGSRLEGSGTTSAELSFDSRRGEFSVATDTLLSKLSFEDRVLTQLIGDQVGLKIVADGKAGDVKIQRLRGQAAQLLLEGDGFCLQDCEELGADLRLLVGDRALAATEETAVDAAASGESDAGEASPEASVTPIPTKPRRSKAAFPGGLAIFVEASGGLSALDATARLEGEDLRFGKTAIRGLDLQTTVLRQGDATTADLTGWLNLVGHRFELASGFVHDGADSLRVENLKITGPQTNLTADLNMALEEQLAEGAVHADLGKLALFAPLLDKRLAGRIKLDLDLTVENATTQSGRDQAARFSALMEDVAYGDQVGGLTELAKAEINGSVSSLSSPTGEAHLAVQGFSSGSMIVQSLNLDAKSDAASVWNLELAALADHPESMVVRAEAALHGLPELQFVDLTVLNCDLAGVPVSLDEPTRVSFANGVVLNATTLRLGSQGSLQITGSMIGEQLDAELVGRDIPLSLLTLANEELKLRGGLNFELDAQGQAQDPRFDFHAELAEIASPALDTAGVAPLSANLKARVAAGQLSADLALAGLTDSKLQLGAKLAVGGANSSSSPMDVSVVGDLDLEELFLLFPLGGEFAMGRIHSDLHLTGTPELPRVDGNLQLREGYYESGAAGTVISDLEIDIVGEGTRLVIARLEANDGGKGKLGGEGFFEMARLPAYEFELSVTADKANLARLDVASAKAGGSITLRGAKEMGQPALFELLGRIETEKVEIWIPNRFAADHTQLEVTEVVNGVPMLDEDAETEDGQSLRMNLRLFGDKRLYVRGRGLDSEWRTGLFIEGTATKPQINGHLTVVRGTLDLLGQRFNLSKGVVTFTGAPDRPNLDLKAESQAGGISAFIEVKGSPSDPEIRLYSDPALPRDEILARVLFGESADSLTPMQSVKLAQSLAALSGRGGGKSFFDSIGSGLGLDRLGVGFKSGMLSVSKYITEDVYLNIVQGLTPEDSQVRVEWELLKSLSVESNVGQNAQGEVGLNWRYDY